MAGPVLASILAVIALALLVHRYRRDQQAARRLRAEFFADCMDVLEEPRLSFDAFGYPCLSGRYEGMPVRTEVVVDALALRKLPSLWLNVTLTAPVAIDAVFDAMMRPSGSEIYSPFDSLPARVDTPEGWPERAVIRTDEPAGLPPTNVLAPYVAILDEPKAKELLISPKGVRLVWQADEAERSDYLLLRQARFKLVRFDADCFAGLVRHCAEVRRALAQAALQGEPAREAAA